VRHAPHELRIDHAVPGRLPDLNNRFSNITLKLWEKFGIREVGFWTTLIGPNNHALYYLLEWKAWLSASGSGMRSRLAKWLAARQKRRRTARWWSASRHTDPHADRVLEKVK
jgi:hypothetical protein